MQPRPWKYLLHSLRLSAMASLSWTIDDTSPMWQYQPFGDYYAGANTHTGAGTRSGWQAWYNGSAFESDAEGGQSSAGSSYHVSSDPEANATLAFHGSGIIIYGYSNLSYAIVVDEVVAFRSTSISANSNVLYANHTMPDGAHRISIVVEANGGLNNTMLSLDSAVVQYGLQHGPSPTPIVVDSLNTSSLNYAGVWEHNISVPGIHDGRPFSKTTKDSSASVTWTFNNSIAIAINGTTDYGAGTYSVTLDGQNMPVYNASSVYLVPEVTLFFMAGLDPQKAHTVTMTNNGALDMRFSSITALQVPSNATSAPSATSMPDSTTATPVSSASTSASHGLSAGLKAVAIVVPIILVILSILAAALFIRNRRRRLGTSATPYQEPNPYFEKEETDVKASSAPVSSKRGVQARALPALPLLPGSSTRAQEATLHPASATRSGTAGSGTQMVDVDRLVELVVERMDRPTRPISDTAPPRYQPR